MVLFSWYKDASILLLFFSHQVESGSLWSYGLQHTKLLSAAVFQSLLKFMSIK